MTWSCFYQQVPRLQAKRDSHLHLLFSSTCHGQTTNQKTKCSRGIDFSAGDRGTLLG